MVVVVTDGGAQCVLYTSQRGANVSSTGCNNERQSFAKLSHSAIDNVLTNLLPAGLHDFFHMLNVSNATSTVNKLSDCSPDWIVHRV